MALPPMFCWQSIKQVIPLFIYSQQNVTSVATVAPVHPVVPQLQQQAQQQQQLQRLQQQLQQQQLLEQRAQLQQQREFHHQQQLNKIQDSIKTYQPVDLSGPRYYQPAPQKVCIVTITVTEQSCTIEYPAQCANDAFWRNDSRQSVSTVVRLSRDRCFVPTLQTGASFQLFLGGGGVIFFIIFQCHRTIEKLQRQHFTCSNLTSFIVVPFFLFFFFFFFFLFLLFFFFFYLGGGGGRRPPAPSNDAPVSKYHPSRMAPCLLSLLFLRSLRSSLGKYGLTQKLCLKN